jgi:hypothetical protein
MKTTDFTTTVTADTLNESMFKKFGSKVNFNKYTREELENYRNILRTKVHQTETGAKFNELLSNEDYQKNKHMLELLNTKIKEMLGEGAKVDRQAAHITKSMMKKGKSKDDAESIAWAHIKHPKKKTTKAEEGIEETTMKKTNEATKGDGNLANNAKPYDKVTRGDVIAGRLGKDAKGGKKVKEAFPTVDDARKAAAGTSGMKQGEKKKSSTGGEITKTATGLKHTAGKNYGGQDAPKAPDSDKKSSKKKVSEEVFKLHVRLVNESLRFLIKEDEEGKAKAITAASDMVNDFTTWMQRVGQYQTKAIVELADAIRSDFGEQEAETFKQTVSPALTATLEVLTQQREAISHAVAVLAGEATEVPQMGAEPGMGEPPMDGEVPMDVEPDSMNPPEDEFGASDAAAGGAETAGREVRESRFIRKIAESHSIMSKLSR